MDENGRPSDSGANAHHAASPATTPTDDAVTVSPSISDAGDAAVEALAGDLSYTLTAGQALEMYVAAKRKVPSLRTIQRYCIEGRIAAQKIRTTYGAEWLINEESLAAVIAAEPVVSAVAGDANATTVATPAMPAPIARLNGADDSLANDDAGAAIIPELAMPTGESRRLSDVLIANAKLVADVEGRDAIIAELKEDRNFLREEVREARRTRDDVKNIAERMLDTLKTMAIGRLTTPNSPSERVQAEVIDPMQQRGA